MASSRGYVTPGQTYNYEQNPFDSTDHFASPGASAVNLAGPATSLRELNAPAGPRPYMPMPSGYSDLDGGHPRVYHQNPWMENEKARSNKSKKIVIACVVGLVILIAVGVGVGVGISKSHSSSSQNLSSSNNNGNSNSDNSTSGVVSQTNPNDPSTFVKNPALKQSFYGLAYTPEGSQYPQCGNELSQVITDIQLMSQLTKRIRLYGADCNQSALVLEAIKQTKVDMTVWLANYNIPTDPAPYERQLQAIVDAINTYGTSNIGGVTVGNEFILDYLSDNGGGDDPNGPIGQQGAALLIANITDTRNTLNNMGLSSMPVGTSDAGSYFNNEVLEAVDYGMANVHPWFANVSADDAAGWTADFFQTTDVALAQSLSNNPEMYIAETGWPTNASDVGSESNGPSNASVANLQIFLDDFVCQANTNGTKYFFFEYFDEIWKDEQFGGVEGWWGLFNANRTLKAGLTIPDCQSP